MTFGLLDGLDHAVDDGLAREDVSLGRAVLATLVAGPRRRLRTCVSGVAPLRVHDRELTSFLRPVARARVGITVENGLDDGRRRHTRTEQRERLRSVAHIDDGLRGRDAHVRFGPEYAVADGKDARLHRAADLAGGGVVAKDREGGNRRKREVVLLWRLRMDCDCRGEGQSCGKRESQSHAVILTFDFYF